MKARWFYCFSLNIEAANIFKFVSASVSKCKKIVSIAEKINNKHSESFSTQLHTNKKILDFVVLVISVFNVYIF